MARDDRGFVVFVFAYVRATNTAAHTATHGAANSVAYGTTDTTAY